MNVLSLFDGISCGRLVLQNLDIKVDNYFAAEIDKHAINISKGNFNDIQYLGDINNIDISKLPKIDLLIGGSPCQGFSSSGKGLNFEDPRSMLFFKYVEFLEKVKPTYFMLENVNMKKEWIQTISSYLKVDPVLINSKLVSAQSRSRLYWANFPITIPTDRNVLFSDIVPDKVCAGMRGRRIHKERLTRSLDLGIPLKQYIECRTDNKSNCLTTVLKDNVVVNEYKPRTLATESEYRYLTIEEYEKLQTLPAGYTDYAPKTHRYKAVGNSWNISTIEHIFYFFKE